MKPVIHNLHNRYTTAQPNYKLKITTLWDVMPFNFVGIYLCFGRIYALHFQDLISSHISSVTSDPYHLANIMQPHRHPTHFDLEHGGSKFHGKKL
jgi:hypothetical protein